jgi:23S rRNA (uridine2552-2'-O)-methyltransferase
VPNEWLRRRKKDHFHRLAKERGYRSRAAFKLQQMMKQYHFIRRGDLVLDLGAAPGGWLQAARQILGPQGFVLGVDKEPIKPFPFRNLGTIVADILQEDETVALIQLETYRKMDVVLSDLAPNVSGVWEVDHARQIDLARHALSIARKVIRPSGNVLVKVFQGSELQDFRKEMRTEFQTLRIVKPPASRSESAELYFLGLGYIKPQDPSQLTQPPDAARLF